MKETRSESFFYINSAGHKQIILRCVLVTLVFFAVLGGRVALPLYTGNSNVLPVFDVVIGMLVSFIVNGMYYKYITVSEKKTQDRQAVQILDRVARGFIIIEELDLRIRNAPCMKDARQSFKLHRLVESHENTPSTRHNYKCSMPCSFNRNGMCCSENVIEAKIETLYNRFTSGLIICAAIKPSIADIFHNCLVDILNLRFSLKYGSLNLATMKGIISSHNFFMYQNMDADKMTADDPVFCVFTDKSRVQKAYKNIYEAEKERMNRRPLEWHAQ